jgi:hypothetical protein
MRLGIISRILIVASCLWMAGGTVLIAFQMNDRAERESEAWYQTCKANFFPGADCFETKRIAYEARTEKLQYGLWGFSAALAAIWLVLAWIAIGLGYAAIRWILAGRNA